MTEIRCEQVCELLIRGEAATPEVHAHVLRCPRCRGSLVALLAERYGVPPPTGEPACAALDDLPAYLDCELAEGEAVAAVRYPAVWWHLWVCAACAEEARLTRALLVADAAGEVAPVPAAEPSASAAPPAVSLSPWPLLYLERDFLYAAITPQIALGAAWSDDDEATLIAEESVGLYRVALYARPREAGNWSLSVMVSPVVRAVAVLRFGTWVFRAPFDATGTATVAAVPGALLSGRVGPPLEVRIEPPEP